MPKNLILGSTGAPFCVAPLANDVFFLPGLRLSHRLSQGSLLPVTPQVTPQVTSRTSDEDRWKVRVAHDFKFGPTDFGELPFWAHFMPAATAQLHTIFSMIVASNGLVFLLDLCDPRETGQIGLIWWPIGDDLCH